MTPKSLSRISLSWIVSFVLSLLVFTPHVSYANEMVFPLTLSEESIVIETEDGLSKIGVSVAGYHYLEDEGAPKLPFRIVNVLLPQGHSVGSFRSIRGARSVILRDFQPIIAPPQVSESGVKRSGFSVTGSPYGKGLYPAEIGRYLGTRYLHGCAIASFAIFPLQVSGGDLMLSADITLRITTEPTSDQNDVARRLRARGGFAENRRMLVTSMVVNPEELDRYHFDEIFVEKPRGGFQPTAAPSLEGSPVDYVIIAPDSFASAYQRLADWKTAKGVPTVVRTVEWIQANCRNGVDIQETIRFFLQDAYAKWGIGYALLGGDTPQIPPRYGYSAFYKDGKEVPAEIYFACLDGSWNANHNSLWGEGFIDEPKDEPDLYPEIYVGRMPSSNVQEVNTMIDKIINYETPYDLYYEDRMIFLAEVLFPVDWKPGEPITLNGADMAEFLYSTVLLDEPMEVTRMYETWDLFPGSTLETVQAALDSMESGLNHVCHIGHGFRFVMSVANGNIAVPEALALSHPDRFFNLYLLNCTATAFDFNCLAEAYLENPDGGAVSCIGAVESAFPYNTSYYMTEYYRLLFDEDVVHIGETFARSRLPRTPYAEAQDNVDLWTHYIYALLGDPEMCLWNGPVDTLNVFHVSNVGLGITSILVNVTSEGVPVDSAVVCLWKGTDDYAYAATNTLGNVTIDFASESPGSISVVVTGLNLARHQSYIVVDPSVDAYVNLSSTTVDDDSAGTSFGNADGSIDAGETVELTLLLANTGSAASDSVWVVIRSDDSLVTVEDSVAAVGIIAAGGTKQALDPVRVHFAESTPDAAAVEFALVVRDASMAEWNDTFTRLVHAPKLELITLRIDDSAPLGNGNGRNEPGEEFKLHYGIKNYGTGAACGLATELLDLEGAFTFFDSTDAYSDLNSLSEGENIDGFHILETSTATEHDLELTITDLHGRVYRDTIELRVPSPPTALEFDVRLGADRIEVSWVKSDSNDARKYRVYHSLSPGGPYELRTTDPVDHTVYLDAGLLGSTRYYYVVTAVDTSGNESDPSLEYSTATNPPQIEGWPIEMEEETVCSPAVGDIDGDGHMEIVAGNNFVYAWHADGIEMVDGDADPQTWGVLNTSGDGFIAPITLGNLDDVLGMDIIAASYWTKEIYCFDYHGDTLAGWPRTTESNVRAAPIVCDLDGDSDPEIVVMDQKGVIYAWHNDGTEYRDGDNNPVTQGVFYRTYWPGGFDYQTPAACDIDDDGMEEIIVGTLGDSVYVLNENGTSVSGWPVGTNGDVAGSIAVGDIDGDDYLELVVPTKSGEVNAYNHDGSILWTRWIPYNIVFFAPSPALADLDNDGKLETIMASDNKKLYVITHTGANFTGWPIQYSATTNTESSPVVADIDSDGSLDILLGDETKYISAWDINGDLLDGFPIATGDFVRATPIVADVDGDGDLELVEAGWDRKLYVWDLHGYLDPTKLPWPTFHANVHRNGHYGSIVPTGVVEATFAFQLLDGAVELVWTLRDAGLHCYDVFRGTARENQLPSSYTLVASNLSAEENGRIRLVDRCVEVGCRYVYKLQQADDTSRSILSDQIYIPIARAGLLQNYPNPFNPTTRITFLVPEGQPRNVSLVIYDVTGARVRTLFSGSLKPGRHEKTWDGKDNHGNPVGSGVYFYQLRQGGFVGTKKMVLLK
ncbi:MAG: T9SS type A sorting domain-containing protein [Candidatus Latescibacteria bacterium]|nr:T9SS type A sorting domain-containing protein [Candidatus Latescibacterota bacterium]NIO27231.1 T9SS type A sorting domain-containing protein [Candidatus Latescibacterota bacterium]NIO54755.1 T9SS type A sorting domain-containing protein [Candidatus Latescibacterota bacterium]NIT00838.1 T9SS type A sorting domain-containing protein [Candidatus Latescibacterota bacterium]NIT37761.1 T9SS type A sorting domain-containing protein [Candidatus Latescibacterota bacterium]